MSIRFSCSTCGAGLSAPEDRAGLRSRCPRCRCIVEVPDLARPALPVSPTGEPMIPPVAIQPISAVPVAPAWDKRLPEVAGDASLIPVAVVRPGVPGLGFRRFVSPAFLLLTLFFLVLPCVEVRCNAGPGLGKTMVTQNGFQAAYGGYSLDRQLQGILNAPPGMVNAKVVEKERVGWAPLMVLALVALLAAIGVGLVNALLRMGRPYTTVVSGVAAFLFFLLLCLQMGFGFPISDEVTKEATKSAKAGPVFGAPQMNGFQFPNVPQQNAFPDQQKAFRDQQQAFQNQMAKANADIDRAGAMFASMMVETRYSVWLWLACLLPLCSLAGAVWDLWPTLGRRFSQGNARLLEIR